ncbi:MAG: tetratricopeptide repeat protein [Spirochaetia bacterium]|nr:tetratricopeptide repeat protein [Spirochaetia bacterium]
MAQTTTTRTQTKLNENKDDNEWLEQFLNTSEDDLIAMTKNKGRGSENEYNVIQIENIIDIKKRANFVFQNRRYKEAYDIIEDAIKLLPGDIDLNFFQAQCLFHLGEIDRVEIILKNLLQSDDKHKMVQIPRMFAYSLLKKKKFAKAQEFLEKSIPEYNFDVQMRNMLGFALEQQNKLAEAENVFSDILTQEPENANANNSLAYIYFKYNKNLPFAQTLAEKAIFYEPQNPAFLDTIAMIYHAMGNSEEARVALQKALTIAPSNPVLLEHLAKILEA